VILANLIYLYMAANFGILGIISLFWLFLFCLKAAGEIAIIFPDLLYYHIQMIGSLTNTQILSLVTAFLFAVFTGLQTHLESAIRK